MMFQHLHPPVSAPDLVFSSFGEEFCRDIHRRISKAPQLLISRQPCSCRTCIFHLDVFSAFDGEFSRNGPRGERVGSAVRSRKSSARDSKTVVQVGFGMRVQMEWLFPIVELAFGCPLRLANASQRFASRSSLCCAVFKRSNVFVCRLLL